MTTLENTATARWRRSILAVGVSVSMLTTAHFAGAQPVNPSDADITTANGAVTQAETNVSGLVAQIADTNAQIAALESEMGQLREAVNKALVDLHDAQSEAEQARQGVTTARASLSETQEKIVAAQATLDEISRSTYRQSATTPSASPSGRQNTDDSLDRQTYLRLNAEKQRAAIDELDRLRTHQANEESLLREARNIAEERENRAQAAKDVAEQAIANNTAKVTARQSEHANLIAQRDAAQLQLDQARGTVSELQGQRAEYEAYQAAEAERQRAAEEAAAAEAAARAAEEEAQRKAAERAAAEQAAAAAAEQARIASENERAAAQARQAEAEAAAMAAAAAEQQARDQASAEVSRAQEATVATEDAATQASNAAAALIAATQPVHTDTEATSALRQGPAAEQSGTAPSAQLAELFTPLNTLDTVTEKATSVAATGDRAAQIEAVIARAQSQIGVPYAWGGGDANGPTRGIRDGGVADSYGDYNKIGFDCSGLVLYAFAGVGIALPHYTGYQYQRGTKIDPSQMQRGDLIFWGPNAEHHVAIYLGDGTMIEAPNSGSAVKISPVRWSGMSPYAVRLI